MKENLDPLINYLLHKYHQGNCTHMAKSLDLSQPRLNHYLYKRRNISREIISLLWNTYGEEVKKDGVKAKKFIDLIGCR